MAGFTPVEEALLKRLKAGSKIFSVPPGRTRFAALLALVVLALGVFVARQTEAYAWFYRAYIPFPRNYVERLKFLRFWNSVTGDGLNCSGFLANAHGESFRTSYDFYYNEHQDLILLEELNSRDQINESQLQPGDFAAFEGPDFAPRRGIHVAAYLGNGSWIDADSRRGYVDAYRLADVPPGDWFFMGHVRVYRWKNDPPMELWNTVNSIGKDNTTKLEQTTHMWR